MPVILCVELNILENVRLTQQHIILNKSWITFIKVSILKGSMKRIIMDGNGAYN